MSQRVLLYLPGKRTYVNLLQVISVEVKEDSYIIKMTNSTTYTVTAQRFPTPVSPYQLLETYLNLNKLV
jgi:hypothetical protein